MKDGSQSADGQPAICVLHFYLLYASEESCGELRHSMLFLFFSLLLFFSFFVGCSSLDQRQAGGGNCRFVLADQREAGKCDVSVYFTLSRAKFPVI